MRRFLVAVLVTLALPSGASAAASWSAGDPGYRYCNGHRCTRVHRAYRERCGGWNWLSPRPIFVPAEWRNWPGARFWCIANIPAFPWNRSIPLS